MERAFARLDQRDLRPVGIRRDEQGEDERDGGGDEAAESAHRQRPGHAPEAAAAPARGDAVQRVGRKQNDAEERHLVAAKQHEPGGDARLPRASALSSRSSAIGSHATLTTCPTCWIRQAAAPPNAKDMAATTAAASRQRLSRK